VVGNGEDKGEGEAVRGAKKGKRGQGVNPVTGKFPGFPTLNSHPDWKAFTIPR
jgi:hypothetical protein